MRFADQLWQSTLPVYDEILRHPFIEELTKGSLSRERFVFYMKQDALYLQDFSRALALTGSRLPDLDAAQSFMGFAHGVFSVERQLHETYFRDYGVSLNVDSRAGLLRVYPVLAGHSNHGNSQRGRGRPPTLLLDIPRGWQHHRQPCCGASAVQSLCPVDRDLLRRRLRRERQARNRHSRGAGPRRVE